MAMATDVIQAVGDALHRKSYSGADGSGKGKVDPEIEVLDRLVRESEKARSERGAGSNSLSFADMAARNAARFLGDHTTSYNGGSAQSKMLEEGYKLPADTPSASTTGVIKSVLNRTQTAILATHAAMTERPVQIAFNPVESEDKWLYVLKKRAARRVEMFSQNPKFVSQINPGMPLGQPQLSGFTSEELAGDAFIDDARAEFLMDTLRNPITGAPLLRDDDFFIVNDVTTARVGKRLFDNRWAESDGDEVINEHAFYVRVFGFQPLFFQWDEHGQKFWLENPHGLSVYPDPVHTRIGQFDYIVWDYYLSLDKAEAVYPKMKRKFKEAAQEGRLTSGKESSRLSSIYGDHDYERAMVCVRTAWIKNAKVPMTEDEAIQSDKVVIQENPAGPPQYADAETGEPAIPPTHDEPEGENWPTTFGILQIQVLPQIGKTIDKRRCPSHVEPMGWTVNVPVFHKAWGLGDPFRLESLQQQINNELTVLCTHSRYSAYPVEFWPADLWEDLRSRGFKLHIRPGRVIPIPRRMYDSILQRGGKFGVTQEPPPQARDRVGLLQMLLSEHDRMSGHVEALQGRTPGAQTSGRTIQQLRQEARGPLGLQAKHLEATVTRIAKLCMESLIKWMRPSLAYEILNAYPDFVVDEYMKRLERGRYNVEVKATMGRGILHQIDREEAQQLYQLGLLDRQTALEDHGRDPSPITRRKRQDMEQDALAQGVMEQQAATRASGQQQQQPQGGGMSAPGGTPNGGARPPSPVDIPGVAGGVDNAERLQAQSLQ